jgi:hypothetical protein
MLCRTGCLPDYSRGLYTDTAIRNDQEFAKLTGFTGKKFGRSVHNDPVAVRSLSLNGKAGILLVNREYYRLGYTSFQQG